MIRRCSGGMCSDFVWVVRATDEFDTERVITGFCVFERLYEVLRSAEEIVM